MPEASRSLLKVEGLVTGYGKRQVVKGVSLGVTSGEVVAVVGHNGAGKSTLLKAIFGLIPIQEGELTFNGKVLGTPNPRELLKAGVAYVPQGNRVFTDLTVRENLEIGGVTLPNKSALNEGVERAVTFFPTLRSRFRQRAGTLSGGEQQMLALGNALVLSPRLLLLDEPSLGLAPPLVSHALRRVQEISEESGVAALIVEQKVREVLNISQRVYVMRNGVVSFSGPTAALSSDAKLREVYL